MNYKKGILSVILWFIYALTAGTVLVGTTMVMLLPEGGSRPIGLVIAGVWLALTGLVVFLLHRFLWVKWAQNGEGSGQVKLIIEGLAVVALIAVGITLRVRESMQYDISGPAGSKSKIYSAGASISSIFLKQCLTTLSATSSGIPVCLWNSSTISTIFSAISWSDIFALLSEYSEYISHDIGYEIYRHQNYRKNKELASDLK